MLTGLQFVCQIAARHCGFLQYRYNTLTIRIQGGEVNIGEFKTYFPVSSGLFSQKHMDGIGQAIWLFLWLIDKTTSEEVAQGERWGVVLYGKPVTARQIAANLFVNERSARRYLTQLEAGGYIRLVKKSCGYVIQVRKSMKWQIRQNQ